MKSIQLNGLGRNVGRLLFLLLPVLFSLALAETTIEKGRLIAKVPCSLFINQSYALYLPSAYDPGKKWPVLYCFDPGARGVIPVQLFQGAAEELGIIVICSNDSRNGINFTPACQAVWADSHSRFSLNDQAVFCTGFSGGAHVAFSFGLMTQAPIAGIIACSNGLPSWMTADQVERSTAIYLLAGLEDFNNQRTKNLAPIISAHGNWSYAEVFPGGHDWPPAAYAATALKALCLQAMKAGRLPGNDDFADRFLADQMQQATAALENGNDVSAYLIWSRMAKIFAGIRNVEGIAARIKTQSKLPAVKAFFSENRKIDSRERELLAKVQPAYLGLFAADMSDPEKGSLMRDLNIERLRENSTGAKKIPEKIASTRVIQELYLMAFVSGSRYFEGKEWRKAETAYEITRRIRPDRWQPYYNLAVVAAQQGEKKKTLQLLQSAVEKGLDNAEVLADDVFNLVRQEKEFSELLQKIHRPDSSPVK